MRITLLLLIGAVIAVSGCVGIPDIFGRDVISVQQSIVDPGVRDVIVVKDIATIPKSPLLPDQQLLLSFMIENRDSVKSSRAYVDLFNAPTMRDQADRPCNFYAVTGYSPSSLVGTGIESSPCSSDIDCAVGFACNNDPVGCSCTSSTMRPGHCTQAGPSAQRYCVPDQCGLPNGCPVLPGEEKPVNFQMKSPTETDIKGIKTQTKLDFKTTYEFEGVLTYIVPAVNSEEITKRQRAGEKTSLFTTKSYGSGPVQIDVELQGAPYMLNNFEAVMLFKIKNRGSGTLEGSQIDPDTMEIIFPPEFDVIPGKFSEKFSCTLLPDGSTRCVNDGGKLGPAEGAIPIYRDESRSSLRFSVRLREPLLEPFRSYQITSRVGYYYELRNSVDLTINPFNNA